MKKFLLLTVFLMLTVVSQAQSMGFSYFFPTNGYFSSPIAPVNFHLPISFGDYLRITPEIGMNNIGGMSMGGIPEPYNSDRPLIGPFQSVQLALSPSIVIPLKSKNRGKFMEIELIGGIMGFSSINPKVKTGQFQRMLMEVDPYEMVQTNLRVDPDFAGWGWLFGIQFDFKIKGNIWGYIAGRYYLASQDMPVSGTYSYYENGSISRSELNFSEAYLNYQGFEITIGGGLKK